MAQTTVAQLTTSSLMRIGVVSPGESIDSYLSNYALEAFNQLLDEWNAQRNFIYAVTPQQFTLIPNHQPHTIGPGALITATSLTSNVATYTAANNFVVAQRVTVTGTANGGGVLNVTGALITLASPTSFSVALTHADITPAADTGAASVYGVPPDFVVADQRPEKIDSANLILNNVTPNVNITIEIRDYDWWAAQKVQPLATNYPTDLYYQTDWPNGSLFFWPIPQTNWPVQLFLRTVLQQVTATQSFTLPPGYWSALMLTLAERLWDPLISDAQISPLLVRDAAKARGIVKAQNAESPRIATGGDGLPSGHAALPNFNWRTGMITSR